MPIKSASDAVKHGIGYLRTASSSACSLTRTSSTRAWLATTSLLGVGRRDEKLRKVAQEYSMKLRTRTPSVDVESVPLSGGNQQKVVVAKGWSDSEVLIFDEPTRH